MKQKCGQSGSGITTGFGNQNEMFGLARAGNIPFTSIDHPLPILPRRRGLDHPRVRPATRRRFGHGKGRPHVTVNNWL